MKKIIIFTQVVFLFSITAFAQDPLRFEEQVNAIQQKYPDPNALKGAVLFTGSSSIRLWEGLDDYFPSQANVNTGFGGSHTSDLLYYADKLILPFQPKKIFIYEGDNDISSDKPTKTIIRTTDELIRKIKTSLPEAEIYLISAKPSISRWNLKKKYEQFNKELNKYANKTGNVTFVDVWPVMLDKSGNPKEDIFVEDRLHMNKKGYDLWADVMKKYM